jgi:hypothetical protein
LYVIAAIGSKRHANPIRVRKTQIAVDGHLNRRFQRPVTREKDEMPAVLPVAATFGRAFPTHLISAKH